MKLRVGYFADSHPEYGDMRTLEQIIQTPFEELWKKINIHKSHRMTTILLFEDIFPPGDEPWWETCDAPTDTEYRVMFDSDAFLQDRRENAGEKIFHQWKDQKRQYPYLPTKGYYASDLYKKFSDITMGVKRYRVPKPDGRRADVQVNIKVEDAVILTRYCPRFKCNIDQEQLYMPIGKSWRIVTEDCMTEKQKMNYVVDRLTTLITIICLTGFKHNGMIQVCAFLFAKMLVLINQVSSDWGAIDPEQQGNPRVVMERFVYGNTFIWFFQVVTLCMLFLALTSIVEEHLAGALAVFVAAFATIFMNMRSFGSTFTKMIHNLVNYVLEWISYFNYLRHNITKFLARFIPIFRQFMQGGVRMQAQFVHFLVPSLGLRLEGEVQADKDLSEEEQKASQVRKTLEYYVASTSGGRNFHCSSVRELERYESDIKTGVSIEMNKQRMLMREAMPQVSATVQVIMHEGTSLCRPEFDAYKSLFRPKDWEEEDQGNPDKVNACVDEWMKTVEKWMYDELGAVDTDRTGVKEILQNRLPFLLKSELSGRNLVDKVKVRITAIEDVPSNFLEHGSQDFYAMVLFGTSENAYMDYVPDRCTRTREGQKKGDKLERADVNWLMTLDLEGGEDSITIALFDENPGVFDKLLGVTNAIHIFDEKRPEVKSEWSDSITVPLYRRTEWRGLLLGDNDLDESTAYGSVTFQFRRLDEHELEFQEEKRKKMVFAGSKRIDYSTVRFRGAQEALQGNPGDRANYEYRRVHRMPTRRRGPPG
jgi:hypothetical protein